MSSHLRRLLTCLLAACAAGATFAGYASASSPAPVTEAQAQQIGTDAYVYGVPLLEFLRQQKTQTSVTVPNDLSDAPVNQLGNQRQLATAAHQVIVAPNNDTLYTMAHLDLSKGPLVLHVPAVAHHHYYVFEFIDPYTNDFHYVGTRTTGDGAGNYVIVGPKFHGRVPASVHRIVSRYERVWIVGRTLVYGPSGLAAAHKIPGRLQAGSLEGIRACWPEVPSPASKADHHHAHRGAAPDGARILRRAQHRAGAKPGAGP